MDRSTTNRQNSPARLLVLEPDPTAAKTLERALAQDDRRFDVVLFTDTETALKEVAATRTSYHAVVASNALPDISGLEFYHRMRRASVTIPAILLFNTGEEADASAALAAGVDDVLLRGAAGSYLKLLPGLLARLSKSPDLSTTNSPERLAVVVRSDPESTEYKTAAHSLEDSEPLWRALVESPFQYFMLVDRNITIRYINKMAPGLRFEDVIGKQTIYDFVPPEDQERVRGHFEELFRAGRAVHFDMFAPILQQWYGVTAGPVFDDGEVVGASVFARDVTEQKLVENRLIESERRFRQLAESIRDVFYVLDIEGLRALYVSPAYEDIYGRSLESVYENAVSWMEAVHPQDRARVQSDFWDMVRSRPENFSGQEFRVVKPDGTVRWIKHRAFVIQDECGEPTQVAGVAADVTEAKEAQEQLRRVREDLEDRVEERTRELRNTIEAFEKAQRLASIGTLAAGIAHEINNPIGAILMAADTALYSLDEGKHKDDAVEAIASIKNDARRVGQIVKTVLQLSRQEASQKWACDPGDIARRARDLTRRLSVQNNVHVDLEIDRGLPQVVINPTEMEQVLVNVISNAIEASRREQSVSVRLVQDGQQVAALVTDQGRGMTQEEVSRIFDPFYTTRQAEGGTGLGLSLTYSILRQHNGTIDVDSTPGKGTCVAIGLPVGASPSPQGDSES